MANTNNTNGIIDITNVNIQKLTLADLIADAKGRNDQEALDWLWAEANKKVTRNGKDGTVKESYQPVNMYRVTYLEKFLGYEKKKAATMTADQRREKMLNALFGDAIDQTTEA